MAGSSGIAPWTEGFCPALQVRFNELFAAENPEFKMEQTGLIEAVMDTSAGIPELQTMGRKNAGTGIGPTVDVIFNQRFTHNNTTTDDPTCAGETEPVNCEVSYDIDLSFRSDEVIFTETELKRICEGQQSFIDRRMASMMNAMAEEANRRLHTFLAANTGAYKASIAGAGTYTVLNADGSTRYTGESDMERDLRTSLLKGRYALVGGGNWWTYVKNQLIGTGQNTGTNIASTKGFDFYFDPLVGDAISLADDDTAFILGNDSFKYSQWLFNAGEGYPKNEGTFFHGTVTHPTLGLVFDINGTYTQCGRNNRQWVIYLEHNYGYAQYPAGIWQNNDPFWGINYSMTAQGNAAP